MVEKEKDPVQKKSRGLKQSLLEFPKSIMTNYFPRQKTTLRCD